jgi:hypothetical protein
MLNDHRCAIGKDVSNTTYYSSPGPGHNIWGAARENITSRIISIKCPKGQYGNQLRIFRETGEDSATICIV